MDDSSRPAERERDLRWDEVRHELGNVSLLIDAVGRVSTLDDEDRRMLADAKRRIDALIVGGTGTDL